MSSTHGNQQVSDAEIVERIKEVSDPVASAAEITAAFCVSRTAINNHLRELRESGRIERKDVGGGYVYWVD